MTTPRKRKKPSRLVTTAFPRKPDLPPSIAGLRMPNSMQTLTAALDAMRVRLDAIEARLAASEFNAQGALDADGNFNRRLSALESRAPFWRRWWRAVRGK